MKFVSAWFEVVEEATYIYSSKCGTMKHPGKASALLKSSVETPFLMAGIMNAKYVNGMALMAHLRYRIDEVLTMLKKDFTKEQLKETIAYQTMVWVGCSIRMYSFILVRK